MPYRLLSFDGVALPAKVPVDDLGVGSVGSTLLDSLGGVFDYMGSTRRLPKRHGIHLRGKYIGEDNTHWVDEVGDDVVDEVGDFVILGADYVADLRDQVDALKGRIGRAGQLVRRREEDSLDQFKTARLLQVEHKRELKDLERIAELDIDWEAAGVPWKRTTSTTTVVALVAGVNAVAVTVAGVEDVRDAVITVTATANITNLIMILGATQKWTFSGTIAAGTALVVDTGKKTVKNNAVDAYSSFTLASTHTVDDWLVLVSGTNNPTLTVTGGPGSVSVVHYDQWM